METGKEETERRTRAPPFQVTLNDSAAMFGGGEGKQDFEGCRKNWGVKEGPQCKKKSLFATQISLSRQGFPTEWKLYLQCRGWRSSWSRSMAQLSSTPDRGESDLVGLVDIIAGQ